MHVILFQPPRMDDELTLLKKKCPVCGKENCSRHRYVDSMTTQAQALFFLIIIIK